MITRYYINTAGKVLFSKNGGAREFLNGKFLKRPFVLFPDFSRGVKDFITRLNFFRLKGITATFIICCFSTLSEISTLNELFNYVFNNSELKNHGIADLIFSDSVKSQVSVTVPQQW